MKITGVKVNVSAELGELDLDIKDVIDVMRLEWEQRKEARRECHECERERNLAQGGPSVKTKEFVEAVVNKAIGAIKEQIKDSLKSKIAPAPRKRDIDPDDRIDE